MKIVLSTLNAKYIHSSLALRYLATFCQASGRQIAVREYTVNNNLLEVLSDLFTCQATVIGFACYIWNIETTLKLATLIKKIQPKAIVVLGGPEVSYQSNEILIEHDAVDYIVLGEGEQTFEALLSMLENNGIIKDIPGLVYRQGKVIVTSHPVQVASLDDIPFPYKEEDMQLLKDKILYYESSRGCPFTCQYCLSSIAQGVRFFNLERVLRDLQFFISYDVKQVKFVDRTFNARKEHYFPILKYLAAQTCRTNFHFEIAADILDQEVVDFLEQAPPGRFQFEIGIQSTNEQTLGAIKRHNNWSKIKKYVSKIQEYGNIHIHLDLIVGLPYENIHAFAQSFDKVFSLSPDMLQIGFLKLLKGSGIREKASEHGYIAMDTAPYEVLANNYMDYATIRHLKILEEVFEQVYNSGRFKYSLPWLIARDGTGAFAFFSKLAGYWEQQEYHLVAHSTKSLYKYISEFCATFYPQELQEFYELLKFDALMSEHGTVCPETLPWNQLNQSSNDKYAEYKSAFWRDSNRVRGYLPNFIFTTWRDVKKLYHIEVFSVDIPGYLQYNKSLENHEVVVLFSYENIKPYYQVIKYDDFWN